LSARPAYKYHEDDSLMIKVDEEKAIRIINTEFEPDFLAIVLLSAVSAMTVLLLLLIRKVCVRQTEKKI
jgi:hypothetical protein